LLRTLEAFMPDNLIEVMNGSSVNTAPIKGDADTLLFDVKDDLEQLKSCYIELEEIAEEEELDHIANYAQDRVLALGKLCWMLRVTLE
jgi:DNA-binding ferritin-like protein